MFDNLVQIAALACETPIAFISFVNVGRQWLNTRCGFPAGESPRAFAVCAAEVFEAQQSGGKVPQAVVWQSETPLLAGAQPVRFYAGVPLISSTGSRLGVFCVIDQKNREISKSQEQVLQLLAKQVMVLLEKHCAEGVRAAESSKLNALGEMAGGIAHEINNPLAIIQARASLLLKLSMDGKLSSEITQESTNRILLVVQRLTKISKGLQAYARGDTGDPFQRVDLFELIEETMVFCQDRMKREGISLRRPAIDLKLTVECRPVQISQVLLNLLNNAIDAISLLPEKWIEISCEEESERVLLTVTDSGSGVEKKLRDKIFQPFFTTKSLGRGSGQGLSVSKDIVKAHQGELNLISDSKNTRFVIILPKSQVQERDAHD